MAQQKNEFSEHMSFEFLELLRKMNPAWRLLASPQAPFVAAFLYKEFIAVNRRQIPEQELISRLESYIDLLNQGQDDSLFPRTGREYLDDWANDSHGWLRKFYPPGQDDPHFDVTSLAQKAVEWLLSLKQQAFIGTESRLITVFDLLHQIVERSETDPELRLAELERRKAEIEQEITRVQNGQVDLLDETQIKERFWQAMTTAREILSDFRAVEQNFRELDRGMRERIATWDRGKGELLESIFAEQDGIAQSEQGKSFAAFWKFLMSSSYQDDFKDTLDRVLQLRPVQEMSLSRNVRHIHHDWVNAGAHVQETVAALSQQLRRYVDENFLEEERRINQIVREIEGKAVAVRNNPPQEWEMAIDGVAPEIFIPLDRPLFSPPQRPEIQDDVLEAGAEDIPAEALFSQVYVDKEKLKERIAYLLQAQERITLSEIIEHHPLELGLSELITYLVIASESRQATFYPDTLEEVSWQDETGKVRVARMAKVIFYRA
jgi:flagellar motility protein MotE (MotC chaperone)